VHATAPGGGLSQLIGACVLRLRDAYATPGGATAAGLGLTLAAAVLARTALTAVTHLRGVRQHAVRHPQTARLVGHAEPALGAVLVDHGQPAAYCVAGPHPTVILTTAALQTLDPDQLDAVLAHERAHLASHDHRLLAIAKIGRQVLPFLPLMRDADTQITRLVEMHADDAATADRDAGAAGHRPGGSRCRRSGAGARRCRYRRGTADPAATQAGRTTQPGPPPAAAGRRRRARADPGAARGDPGRRGPGTGTGPSRLADPLRPKDDMTNTPGGRRWRPRARKILGPARPPEPASEDGLTVASSMQLAIGLLTASLDSPELEEWAAWAVIPEDPASLASVIAGLHLVNLLLLQQLHEATGQPPAATLQKLAISAAAGPETPFAR